MEHLLATQQNWLRTWKWSGRFLREKKRR